MKEGDLVRLYDEAYPRYQGHVALLIETLTLPDSWVVLVNGKEHPFMVTEKRMKLIGTANGKGVINES